MLISRNDQRLADALTRPGSPQTDRETGRKADRQPSRPEGRVINKRRKDTQMNREKNTELGKLTLHKQIHRNRKARLVRQTGKYVGRKIATNTEVTVGLIDCII